MIAFDLLYNRLPSPSLGPWVESVSLVDRVSGRASTLSVTLCNADGRFLGPWKATKGDSLALSMPPAAPDVYSITKITAGRAPSVVTWEAEGRPATTSAPSGRGNGTPPPSSGAFVSVKKSWEEPLRGVDLRAVAERVCAECGLSLKYVAKSNPKIAHVARYNETGFHLLDRLCRRFALTLRATSGAVTILPLQAMSEPSPAATVVVPGGGLIAYSASDTIAVRSVRSARLDPRSARPVRMQSGDGDGTDLDLDYDADAASELYAASVASAAVAVVDIVPQAGIVAGSIVDIPGLGLREVTEMRYNRTGDTERMSITVRAAR